MKAEIISIGNELLNGKVLNTNALFIAEKLNSIGIEVQKAITVGDDINEIITTFKQSFHSANVIISTGGLGPTHDDITKKAICKFFKTKLTFNQEAKSYIEQYLKERNISWNSTAEEQAMIPAIASIIPNAHGTAPGIIINQKEKYFISLPGVPHEMEAMILNFVIPLLSKESSGSVILHRILKTTCVPESVLYELIGNPNELSEDAELAYLPSPGGVEMRITVKAGDRNLAIQILDNFESKIRERIGKYIYGTDEETLEEIIGIHLRKKKLSIAVAESCTGGLIAHRITNIAGSSHYFDRAVICYSNQSKIDDLGVAPTLIQRYGAVSKEVAKEMAIGVKRIAKTSIGVSTTGIAGPSGGSIEKPVGLVWIGYADDNESFAREFHFGNDRIRIKERATQACLDIVRRKILGID